jgi:DNA-binding LacI/PurR family transcriptional regulator
LSAPCDISLIGFDNHALADLMDLTTIAQPVREQGARAAQLLLDVLDGHGGERRITMPTRLVVRGTTGPADRAGRQRNGGSPQELRGADGTTRS